MKKYDELQDVLPKYPPPDIVAKQTIQKLEAIRKIDTELFINALQSSALLALAGYRAHSPYHAFSKAMSAESFKTFNEQLAPLGMTIISEDHTPFTEAGKNPTWFSFFNVQTLLAMPERYRFLRDIPLPFAKDMTDALQVLSAALLQNYKFVKPMETGKLPKAWLKDWWAPHNLRFGMELGYPGAAISAGLWIADFDKVIEIIVDHDKVFDGTYVSFYAAPGQDKDPVIMKQVELWQKLIAQVREHYQKPELMKNPQFKDAYRAILKAENFSAAEIKKALSE